jgi:hypothetical protein
MLVPGCSEEAVHYVRQDLSLFLFDDQMELFRSESWRFYGEEHYSSIVFKQLFIANCMSAIQVKSI